MLLQKQTNKFSFDTSQPRTQDLEAIHCQTCAFFIWRTKTFIESYKKIIQEILWKV